MQKAILAWRALFGESAQGRWMPTAINSDELRRLLADEQAQLVEVLPEAEFADEHLPGAINIPLKQLDRDSAAQLDRSDPVIVYCYDTQ
jgi:rhodanese-related sulfurtransferase